MKKHWRIGLVINPFAGIGGQAGMKGSDGAETQQAALAYHQAGVYQSDLDLLSLRASIRSQRFIKRLISLCEQSNADFHIDWFTGSEALGQWQLKAVQHSISQCLHITEVSLTQSASDTKKLAQSCLENKLDVLLFAGGDGTARDILDVVQSCSNPKQLCLGIPVGVKMQSAVFAITPEAAAEMLVQLFQGELNTAALQEVRDIDEQQLRLNQVRSKYYGELFTLSHPRYLQHLKQGGVEQDSLVLDDIVEHLQTLMSTTTLMLVGPGSTTAYFMRQLGLANTLVGFDAVCEGKLLHSDLSARDCEALLKRHPDLLVVISPTGRQGFIFGRGNQQLSPQFLRQITPAQLVIVASKAKLASLAEPVLLIDTDDPELDQQLSGLYPVVSAFEETVIIPASDRIRLCDTE